MIECLSIILLVFVLYSPTFKFGIIVDDESWFKKIKGGYLFGAGNLVHKVRQRLYGGGTLARKINGKWEVNYKHEHIFTTALHALTCVLMYFAFGNILFNLKIPNAYQISFWSAILYAVNPANNQTAIWLNGRRYQINIILVLLMMLIGPVGMILYPLTGLLQVSAFFAPVLYGPLFALALPILYLMVRKEIKQKIAMRTKKMFNNEVKFFHPRKLILIVKIYGAYFLKMIFPGRTLIVYQNLYYFGMTKEGNKNAYALNLDFFAGVVFFLCSCLGFAILPRNLWPLAAFMILSTLQWCGFIYVTQIFADRYISLPNVFMMFFVSYLAHTFLGFYDLTVLAALATYYMVNLQITMKMYPSIFDCYDYNIYFNRSGVRCRENKAARLISIKDPMGAWEVIKEGLILAPKDMKMNMMAAHCCMLLDDRKMVLNFLREAKRNCYFGQEEMLRSYQKMFFGIDIDAEVEKIQNKESKLDRKQREEVLKIRDALLPEMAAT